MKKDIVMGNGLMKSKYVGVVGTVALLMFASSCGSNNSSASDAQREAEIADSIAQVREQQKQDSIRMAELKDLYANAISISTGKKTKRYGVGGVEGYQVKLPCTLKNNTSITIEASEYKLECTRTEAVCSDGSEPDVDVPMYIKSKMLNPWESIQVIFIADCAEDLKDPKVTLNISEEDFIQRVKAQED